MELDPILFAQECVATAGPLKKGALYTLEVLEDHCNYCFRVRLYQALSPLTISYSTDKSYLPE